MVYCPSGIIHIQTQERKCNVRGNNDGVQYESVEITSKMHLVIAFIIPKFIGGSTCFERHTAHHQELQIVFADSGFI
jgi:hypothetical protein